MQGTLRYYSEVKARTGSRDNEFFDFFPREGPTGGRVVLMGVWCYANWQVDITGAAEEGEDFARIFGRIQIETRQGVKRWNLTGAQTRIASYAFCGPEKYSENADTGASETNLTGTTAIYVPLAKPLVHTPDDFALPGDEFGKVIITDCAAADLDIGSCDATIDSVDYYLILDAVEEHDLQLHCTDVVKADLMTSTSEGVISVMGKLHDLIFWAAGAAGGASLANLTDVRIDEPAGVLPTSKRTELLREYRWKRGVGSNLNGTIGGEVRSDPFTAGKAVYAIVSTKNTSAWAGPYMDRLKINMTNSVSSVYAITRTVKPRPKSEANAVAAAYGLKSADQLSVKTDKKTQRSLSDWPKPLHPYLRLKAPLRAAA